MVSNATSTARGAVLSLPNDLISPRKERGRHIEPERLGGLQVDHQLVLLLICNFVIGCPMISARSNARRTSQVRHHSRSDPGRSRVAGRRLARGIHMGRAGSSARGAVARDRWHFRHVGRRDECRVAGRWPRERRGRRRTDCPGEFLASRLRGGSLQPFPARATRCASRPLDSSPVYVTIDLMSRLLSPYDLNPMGKNTLRAILAEAIDFERLARAPVKLFITATNVRTGRGHVFKNDAITPDVLLASACLPTMFQAIEIDGEPHWDGGYSGNPTITPLIRECKSQDTILVQINPVEREGRPRSASEILNRLNEVSFNAVLLKELRMIAVLRQVADPGNSEGAQWAGMRIHRVASEMLTELGASSKLNAEWEFFSLLHDEGRRSAQVFLETHALDLGCRSTLDLDVLLQNV